MKPWNETLFGTFSVREWLYEGVTDPLFNFNSSILPDDIKLPPFDKFGWFYQVCPLLI